MGFSGGLFIGGLVAVLIVTGAVWYVWVIVGLVTLIGAFLSSFDPWPV